MSFCTKCGKPIGEQDKFCKSCGAAIGTSLAESKVASPGSKDPTLTPAEAIVETKKVEQRVNKDNTEEAVYRGMSRFENEKKAKKLAGTLAVPAIIIACIVGFMTKSLILFFIVLIVGGVLAGVLARMMYGLPISK